MRPSASLSPALRFSPTAWAKLLYLRDHGPTEVGGFAISPAEDLLSVEDIRLVRQVCTTVSVQFEDTAVAEFFDEQVDAGRRPEQFARVWVHTHPGSCPLPSHVDERTFDRVFGRCDWAVMVILAKGGQVFARLRYAVRPGGAWNIPVEVDFSRPFLGTDIAAWEQEYQASVQPAELFGKSPAPADSVAGTPSSGSVRSPSADVPEEFPFDPFDYERIPFGYEPAF